MLTSTLRTVGGSVMLAVPKPVLDALGLETNEKVALSVDQGRLIVEPRPKPRYTLADLLAQCDEAAAPDAFETEWDAAPAVGLEVL